MDIQELSRLMKVDPRAILKKKVEPFGTEYDLVRDTLAAISKVRIAEREITLPGLTRYRDLILAVLAEFRDKEQKNIMPLAYAKSDHIVIMALRPEHFGLYTWKKEVTIAATKYTATDNIIPTSAGVFTVPEKQIFIITDLVDFAPESPVTAIQVADIDGNKHQPFSVRKDLKLSDLHVIELDFPLVADSTLDLDALVERTTADASAEEKVTHELTPFGVWIGYGKDVPKLRVETES